MSNEEIKQKISDLITKYNNKIRQEKEDDKISSSNESVLINDRISVYESINRDLMKLLCSIK